MRSPKQRKWGRVQRITLVLDPFVVLFKVPPDLNGGNIGNQISDADDPYLEESDRMDKIFTVSMDLGVHLHRNAA